MKRQIRSILAAGLVFVLTLALAACGGSAGGGADDAETVLAKARAAFEQVESMHYTMDMDMGFTADGDSIEIGTTAEADCIIEPMQMDMDMKMDMMGLFAMDIKMYLAQDGDSYTVYTGMDDGEGNITWSRDTMDDLNNLAQYDASYSMDLYLDNSTNFAEKGTEEVAGVTAVRYDGVITQESLDEVMETSGVLEEFEAFGVEGLDEMLHEMGDLPVSVWIEPDSGLPVKFEMDMTAMMQNMMDKIMARDEEMAEAAMTVDKCHLSMAFSDYNAIDAVHIPQEALDAPTADQLAEDLLTEEESQALEEALEDAG
jgi:hypothetical protein